MGPMNRLLTHIIQDKAIKDDVTLYLRDVADNVEAIEDDIRALITRCESLESQLERLQAQKTERTVYVLTVMSGIFLPAQFLTGVYGMNFEFMPELHWRYSYGVFWIAIISIMLSLLLYFRCGHNR